MTRERCNELCTKPTTGQCDHCDALDASDAFWRLLMGGFVVERWRDLWWPLDQTPQTFTSEDAWRRQHDETSTTIRRTMLALLTFSFFCLLSLGAPDASLLSATAKIKLPFADTEIGYLAFLIIAPFILIILSVYLHIFVGYHRTLKNPGCGQVLPFIFNLHGRTSKVLTGFLFHWMVPLVLVVFSWKASPRPEGYLLILLMALYTMIFVGVAIRRWPTCQRRSWWYHLLRGMQILLLIVFVVQALRGTTPLWSRQLNPTTPLVRKA